MTGRVDTGATYRVGRGGVRITWRDGSTTSHSAGTTFVLERSPLRVNGRLFRVTRSGHLRYEAPRLES
jgi:hypothetical protein